MRDLSWRGVCPGQVALPWVRGPSPACMGTGGPCPGCGGWGLSCEVSWGKCRAHGGAQAGVWCRLCQARCTPCAGEDWVQGGQTQSWDHTACGCGAVVPHPPPVPPRHREGPQPSPIGGWAQSSSLGCCVELPPRPAVRRGLDSALRGPPGAWHLCQSEVLSVHPTGCQARWAGWGTWPKGRGED